MEQAVVWQEEDSNRLNERKDEIECRDYEFNENVIIKYIPSSLDPRRLFYEYNRIHSYRSGSCLSN